MTEVKEPSEQALRIRDEVLKLVVTENELTGDTQSVFHGVALAFGAVLSSVQPDAESAAAWMDREAKRMRLTDTKGGVQ